MTRFKVKNPLPDEFCEFLTSIRYAETKGEPGVVDIGGVEYEFWHFSQVNDLIKRLYMLDWSIRAIANAFGGCTGRAIENRIERSYQDPLEDWGFPQIEWPGGDLPDPLDMDINHYNDLGYVIPDEVAEEMARLQPIAQQARHSTPYHSPVRIAGRRLAILMIEQYVKGAGIRQISDICGITYSAVRFRLGRYGLGDLPESYQDNITDDLSDQIDIEALKEERRKNVLRLVEERRKTYIRSYAENEDD